jgi:hypothetical protein
MPIVQSLTNLLPEHVGICHCVLDTSVLMA